MLHLLSRKTGAGLVCEVSGDGVNGDTVTQMGINAFGQPVGDDLAGWNPPRPPPSRPLKGSHVVLLPMEMTHAGPLHESLVGAPDSIWTYMSSGPFSDSAALSVFMRSMIEATDRLPYSITTQEGYAGFLSYLRIQPDDGVLEVGSIVFPPAMQRTTAATESVYLMIHNAFDLGYRRVEWKCDDLNQPSRSAAVRLGFSYEGTFRQAIHNKGRNRDTAWYAITDKEWPLLDTAFQIWLDPGNFKHDGSQIKSLAEVRSSL